MDLSEEEKVANYKKRMKIAAIRKDLEAWAEGIHHSRDVPLTYALLELGIDQKINLLGISDAREFVTKIFAAKPINTGVPCNELRLCTGIDGRPKPRHAGEATARRRGRKVFRETASGARADRAQLRRVIEQLQKDDVLIVTRLDRLARSTRDLLNTLATSPPRTRASVPSTTHGPTPRPRTGA